jgi:peptidoglycan hydrolase-like amidase
LPLKYFRQRKLLQLKNIYMKTITLSPLLNLIIATSLSMGVLNAQTNKTNNSALSNESSTINKGTLSFFVRDVENGYGIKSEIHINGNGEDYTLKSDDGGHAYFTNKEGKYDVTFTSADHNSLHTYFFVENGNTVNIQTDMDRTNRTSIEDITLSNALIEGYVIDFTSGKPMKGVTVSMGNKVKTTSDEKGHFSVSTKESSVINTPEDEAVRKSFTFSSKGYSSYTVKDLLLSPTKISLNITLQKGQGKETEKYIQHVLDGTQQDVDMYEQNRTADNDNSANKSNNSVTSSSGCTIPTTIRVGLSCSCTSCSSVSVMSLQTYTEKGIDNEWISSWQSNSLSAGSVAYRTYGAYYVNHPVKPNFDIASTTCNQVWASNVYANCQAAALATAGMVLTSDGVNPARSEFSAENNGLGAASGTSCGNCMSGTGSGYPCFSDNVCCGKTRFGHGRGMCQWGTQRWSQSGKNYSWIVDHYYTIGNMTLCGSGSSSCATPSGFSVTSITASSATLNWGTVAGATSYVIKYKPTNSSTWLNTASTATSKVLTGLLASTTYEFQVQAVCSNTGNFSVSVSFTTHVAIPSNDNCSNAQSLTPNTTCVSTQGTVAGATASGLTKASCDAASAPHLADVWYKFLATGTSHIITVTPSSGLDAVLSLYSSCNGAQLGCSDHGGGTGGVEKITATGLTIGTTYYVRVYSYGSTTPSTSTFNICVTTPSSLMSNLRELSEEDVLNSSFVLYPNPSDGTVLHGKLPIDDNTSEALVNTSSMTIMIYDVLGKELFSRKIIIDGGEFTLSFDEGNLKPGIYIFCGITNDNKYYKKNLVVN